MSEEFDSKLQEIEQHGDDSREDDHSDHEELEKGMGETEQVAKKWA